ASSEISMSGNFYLNQAQNALRDAYDNDALYAFKVLFPSGKGFSNTSLAWGAGVQFNPTESVTIDLAYEGSGSGDWRSDAFIVGIGYRF
ncbi:Ail/Lom family outer membrane beta-barrel protein, partial [Escherichia coli]|uniref:Ail/Lom family outer membrane beta-barrel protein n=1 Tax=Escherichia coli TaxID=562 RepID=UPI0035A62A73